MIHETGDASVLNVEDDVYVMPLADGECLVKNAYAGLNFIDTYHRSGLYPRDLPFIGGQEGAGVVQGMTAHFLTHSAHADLIAPGEWMLVNGAGGGTCQWAAQMAKIKGYKVIGTAAKGKADIARSTGVDELILLDETPGTAYEDYESVDITAKVMEITGGEGVKAVVDGIGLATWEISLACLARRGIFVTFGNASGAVPPVTPLKLIGKSAFMCRPKLLDYTVTRDELIWRSSDVFKWIADGRLKVSVDKTFSLDEATDGHLYIEA